ncbi:hypothetical protein RHAL1_01614 [Beijerinckiaceae bacterium RH AL1]|nr:DUF559 domain-containing protein [Beijerinckiaceae bacterium]VVB45136.1 hypothetical protein RHCH11_RHCH11_01577 [Beijerinckiaceae bacterium RH CH11]VVB45215.1 hypothetical protein RHAL8_01573 [Beijerinckiaceae bacterium RH AL8]VVC54714.1 hypothetical protein RHAL1_01614 [Beijerinckiaceae bacterium RH AL1]
MAFPVFQPPKPALLKRARAMRRAMTEAETRLWHALLRRLPAYHFRRQVPIGAFIADFCCYRGRLVIEVDGNQHGLDEARARDARRTAILESEGFRVVRFSNAEVFSAIDSVLDTILAHLEGRAD